MEKIIKSPLQEKRKVSMDLDSDFLEQIEALAKLTNASKGTTIEAIGYHGFPILLDSMKLTWQGLLIKGNLDKNKKDKISKLLKNLTKIKQKWDNLIKKE